MVCLVLGIVGLVTSILKAVVFLAVALFLLSCWSSRVKQLAGDNPPLRELAG